jgi:hypothetical protein
MIRGGDMKRFKVEQLILCEVRVWGYVEADHMPDALTKIALEVGTDNRDYDHEIIGDIKTLSVEVKEELS